MKKFGWFVAIVLVGCGIFCLHKLTQGSTKTLEDIRAEQEARDGDSLLVSKEYVDSLLRASQEKKSSMERKAKESKKVEEIGRWYDGLTQMTYHLYREDGKTFLDLGFRKMECSLRTIKGKEFVFQDNDGTFCMEKGTKVYVGYGFEERTDGRGDYSTSVVMRVSGNNLYVYTNDIDRRYFQELCIARKL